MKFLIDVQLPGKLADWLRARGFDAVHALELGLGQADDTALWKLAGGEERIMISKDEDFFILATRPGDEGRLLWLRMGNCRTGNLLMILEKRWPDIEQTLQEGQQIVEVR